ncbi:hypothetical protein ACBS15_19450, partial [Clostridioides difficile]
LTNKCLIITKKINFYSKNTHKYFQTHRNGILIAVILCLLSSITYFEIDLITTKSIFYPLSKQTPIENRTNSKPTYQINVYIDN